MKHLIKSAFLLLCAAVLAQMYACTKVYDDLSSCPQGVVLKFRGQTPCGDQLDLQAVPFKAMQIFVFKAGSNTPIKIVDAQLSDFTHGYTYRLEGLDNEVYDLAFYLTETPEAYADGDGKSWKLNSDKIQNRQIKPELFYGYLKGVDLRQPIDPRAPIDTVVANVLPMEHTMKFNVTPLKKQTDYLVSWTHSDYRPSLEKGILPIPEMTEWEVTSDDEGRIKIDFSVINPLTDHNNIITITEKATGKVFLRKTLREYADILRQPYGLLFNPQCYRDINIWLLYSDPKNPDVEPDNEYTYQTVSLTICLWNRIYRIVDF